MTTDELKQKIRKLLPECEELQDYEMNRIRNRDQRHVPIYHFSSPGGYQNDPSGYCFYKGVYHLFYQFVPEKNSCLGWGHAVSADRFHWIDLLMALRPLDEDCCCSGGILLEENRAVVCYPCSTLSQTGCHIHVAESVDDLLLYWTRIPQESMISTFRPDGSRNPYIAFDPYMWKKDDVYYLLSAAGGSLPHDTIDTDKRDFRRFNLFSSKDLKSWEYHHSFMEDDCYAAIGDDGACPYFIQAGNGKHVIFHYSHMSGGHCIVGTYNEAAMKFHAEGGEAFNSNSFYSGTHAPSAYSDEDGTMHVIFNVNYGKLDSFNNQIMSLPRQYRLAEDNTMLVEPDGAYQSLRYDPVYLENYRAEANAETVLEEISGDALELEITADVIEKHPYPAIFMPSNLMPMVEIRVLRSPDAEEFTAIRFYRNRSKNNWEAFLNHRPGWIDSANSVVEVDTSHSTLAADVAIHPTESQEYYIHPDEPMNLHIFVDKSIVEVFAGGRKCIAVRAYPTRDDSVGVSVLSRGVPVEISCKAWKMKPCYS